LNALIAFASRLVRQWRMDPVLVSLLLILMGFGLLVLYSASEQDLSMVWRQVVRLAIGLAVMFALAQTPPRLLLMSAPWLYIFGVVLLLAVAVIGVGRGAQRWLDLGLMRFQPSEALKLVLPLMLAAVLHRRPLPPRFGDILVALGVIALPVGLILIQPDLGTAILIGSSGLCLLFLSGLQWRWIVTMAVVVSAAAPFLWMALHDYQRNRILIFLKPERDPLGAGWNIVQSKVAIGSGGLTGKGWTEGTQSHLEFLPEPHTDFILSVLAEEFGFLGVALLLLLYALIIFRSLFLAIRGRDSFARLLGGGLVFLFLLYLVVNAGMITGLLPVVGVPLPLVSYGGTSAVTLLAGFGVVMGLYSRRRFMG